MTESHDEIAELLGVYALDAVDDDERALVEQHLGGCPRCAAEVADHREVAAMLAHTGAPAPDGVWTRILSELEEPPPELQLPSINRTLRADPVVSLDAERARRRPSRWIPAAAVAAVLVLGLFAGSVLTDDGTNNPPVEVAQVRLEDVARRVLNDPDATKVTLSAPAGELSADVAIDRDGSGYLLGTTLPALDESRTYQLWGIRADAVVSLGVLGSSPGVVAFQLDDTVETLAITEETAGGVPVTANSPVLVGDVS